MSTPTNRPLASRGAHRLNKGFLIAAAIIVAVILYGSLYPFTFYQPEGGIGPLNHLVQSWGEKPGRGDFIANVFFYVPLGFFLSLAIAGSGRTLPWILLVTLAGGLLSTTMEATQYYIAGRVSAANDVYANLIGTGLGAIVGNFAGGHFLWLQIREIAANRVPALLLALWLAYRLYPYVPAIDLHKYWDALKPVVFHPRPTGYDLFRYTAIWLTVGSLIESVGGRRRGWLLFPLFIAAVLSAKVVIIGKALNAAEIGGAGTAFAIWLLLAISVSARVRFAATALLFSAYIVAERLEPFQFSTYRRAFGWLPFYSFLYGSTEVNIMSFLEKAFLYGALIWLLDKSGLRTGVSIILVAIMLFAASWAETYLPDRSAEITDALMALLIGVIITVVKPPTESSRKGMA